MTAYYTYASLTSNNHADISAISNGLTALGIEHVCNAQTVLVQALTLKQQAQIDINCDDWAIANGANLLRTNV